jgi:predicted RNA-binding Zn ribbon-like protein
MVGLTGYKGYLMAKGIQLQALNGQRFWFDPGALCLELIVTGGEGFRSVWEILHTPADLQAWIEGSSLHIRVDNVSPADLLQARQLREAIYRCADALVEGTALPQERVDDINRAAARPPLVPQIGPDDGRTWGPASVEQVLSTLARDAVDLITGPRVERIRRCSGTNCALIFVDTSRPGARHWCSMGRCGNRAKVRAFRSRRRKEESHG